MTKRKGPRRTYRILAETLPVGVLITDEHGTLTYVNPALEKMFGIPCAESVGTHFRDYITPESARNAEEVFLGCAQGRTVRDIELKAIHRDRHTFPIEITASPLIRDGKFVGVESVVRDITERKHMEEALRESERRLALALSGTQVGLYDREIATGDILGTGQYAQVLGLGTSTMTTLSQAYHYQDWARRVHPEDLPAAEARLQRCAADQDTCEAEYRVLWPDGSMHWVVDRGVLQCGPTGQPTHVLGVVLDVTARKEAEEALRELTTTLERRVAERTAELEQRAQQLQKMTLELSEAEDRERQRLAEILHDNLQQELAAAKFHVGLMRSQAQNDPALRALAAQVDHMLQNAIDKSRSLSHELSPTVMHHADLGETLRWLARQIQDKHGLVVQVAADTEVHSESEAIKALVYKTARELLFNIVKHARTKEAVLRVRQGHGCICLSVCDRGRGFDPQTLGETGGFGLLSIRERLELLQGSLTIRSAPGRGSRFFVVVPEREAAPRSAETPPNGRAEEAEPRPRGDASRLRVLLVDDHEIVREGLISLLRDEHEVEVVGAATNGQEAVDLAGRLEPDVVIMDVSLPLLDGAEATRQIKAHRPDTRVIALSMHEEPETREEMRQAGADHYVLKTAPSEELLAALRGEAVHA